MISVFYFIRTQFGVDALASGTKTWFCSQIILSRHQEACFRDQVLLLSQNDRVRVQILVLSHDDFFRTNILPLHVKMHTSGPSAYLGSFKPPKVYICASIQAT